MCIRLDLRAVECLLLTQMLLCVCIESYRWPQIEKIRRAILFDFEENKYKYKTTLFSNIDLDYNNANRKWNKVKQQSSDKKLVKL